MKKIILSSIIFLQKNYIMLFSNCFCILVLIYIFYVRLFIVISQKILNNLIFLFILTGIFIIFLNIWLLYRNITGILQQSIGKTQRYKNKYINILFFKIKYIKNKIFYEFLLTYEKIIEKIINIPILLVNIYYKPTRFIINKNISYTMFIYYVTLVFPRILVTLVFFFEVIYFKEINYFYKSLWVLIIPLISKTVKYTYQHIAYMLVAEFEDYFFIITKKPLQYNNPLNKEIVTQFFWIDEDGDKKYGEKVRQDYENLYIEYKTHHNYWSYTYSCEKEKKTIIIDIIISLLLIISWCYIITYYYINTPQISSYIYIFFLILYLISIIVILLILYIDAVRNDIKSLFNKFILYLKN